MCHLYDHSPMSPDPMEEILEPWNNLIGPWAYVEPITMRKGWRGDRETRPKPMWVLVCATQPEQLILSTWEKLGKYWERHSKTWGAPDARTCSRGTTCLDLRVALIWIKISCCAHWICICLTLF